MELNFLAAVRCVRRAVPPLRNENGHLVLIGSLASKTASKYIGPYAATKFALASYAQQLRLELQDPPIHVLHVCPGPIARDDAGNRYDEEAANLPPEARKAGGGVGLRAIAPDQLAQRILTGCEKRQLEIVVPWKARILFAVSQLSAEWGDWLFRKQSKS